MLSYDRTRKFSVLIGLLLTIGLVKGQTTYYYSKSTGNLNLTSTWGRNADGSGTSPANFTSANCAYVIKNTSLATIGAAWTVSGANSAILVGDTLSAVEFDIPTSFGVTGTVKVTTGGTLTIESNTNPTLGSLMIGSTVNYARTAAQTVVNAAYYDLILSGSGQKSFANTTNSSISNSLVINSGTTVRFNTVNTLTTTITGSISGSGAIVGNGNTNLVIGGSGAFGTLTFTTTLSVRQLVVNRSSGLVTLGSNLTISTDFTHSAGNIDLNGTLLTLSGTINFPTTYTNGVFVGSSTSSLTIGANATLLMANALLIDQTSLSSRSLSRLSFSRVGDTLQLGNDLVVSNSLIHSNGLLALNGHSLAIGGVITFPAAVSNGVMIGSVSSSLTVNGAGLITNSMKLDQASTSSRTLKVFTIDHTGGTLTFGSDIICEAIFTHSNGPVALGTTSLTLKGNIVFPASATNGSFTGSATSSLSISDTGSIVGSLYMSQASAAARTLNNFALNRTGASLLLGNPFIVNEYNQTNGTVNLNGTLLTLNGSIVVPTSSVNGLFVGSVTSSLTIGTSANGINDTIYFDPSSTGSRSMSRFSFDRTGQTLQLSNDVVVLNNFVLTNGNVDLNGRILTIGGIITFPVAATNGVFLGSATSSLIVNGTGAITNSFRLDQTTTASHTLKSFTVDHTGGTLVFGTDAICDAAFTHSNGPITLGTTSLTLNGNIVFPAAATNGSFTGSATSSIAITGTGSISGSLYMSQATAAARTLNSFLLDRASTSLVLGNALTVNEFFQTNGNINLNGTLLTLNGSVTFPAASTNGLFIGSSTSSITIGTSASTMSNSLFMDPASSASRSLSRFSIDRSAQKLLLGSDLIVLNNFVQTNANVDLNGQSLSIGGIITFPVAATNGIFIGSTTSSLTINGTGAVTNSLRLDQTSISSRTLKAFTIDHTGGTVVFATDIICDAAFTHSNGPVTLGTTSLTLNGNIMFPAAATNGSFTGSATSSLTIGGSGSISGTLFMSQASAAARTLNKFSLGKPSSTVVLGNAITVNEFSQTDGSIDLNGTLFTLNGGIVLPATSANGKFIGSTTSSITIGTSTNGITNSLFMDQTSAASRSMSRFSINRASQTLQLGSDFTVLDNFVQTNGTVNINGQSFSVGGIITFPAAAANGVLIGSSTSSLTINGSGAITNSLRLDQASTSSKTLRAFKIDHTGGTLVFATDIICDAAFTHSNGPVTLGTTSLTLNGNIVLPASASNGSLTGSATSSIAILGSGSIAGSLYMSQASAAARTFNSFLFNRSAATVTLGNAAIVNALTQTNGFIDLGGSFLTLNGAIVFPASGGNGAFIGSTTSSLTIGNAGIITNSLRFSQTSSSQYSLYDFTLARAQSLNLATLLEIRNSVTPTSGTLVTNGLMTLKADATRTGMIGVVGGVISGTVNAETYAPGGQTGWVYLGPSGVTGMTVADWESQMPMSCQGCPNNQYSAGGYFVSIQSYNETLSGNAAYVPLTYTSSLVRGNGYLVYLGTGSSTTSAITYSVKGPAVTGVVTIPVTNSANSGFNLVSNPYAAPIDWDLVSTDLSNVLVSTTAYFYNPDIGQDISYVGGVSTPSGYISNGIIPAGQGFYVQALSGTSITFRESHKSTLNTSANPLLKQHGNEETDHLFRLRVDAGGQFDETVVRLADSATYNFDRKLDALKMLGMPVGHPSVQNSTLRLFTRMNGKNYAINSVPPVAGLFKIPVELAVDVDREVSISALNQEELGLNGCVTLHDKLLNKSHDLAAGSYTCRVTPNTCSNRFELSLCKNAFDQSVSNLSSSGEIRMTATEKTMHIWLPSRASEDYRVSIYDMSGRPVVADVTIDKNSNKAEITLPVDFAGLALVDVHAGETRYLQKVPVE